MVECFWFSLLLGSKQCHFIFCRYFFSCRFVFDQTLVIARIQSLYSMASSALYDSFSQEANTLSLLCVLMSNNGRDVTRTSHTSRMSFRVYAVRSLKTMQWSGTLYSVCFLIDFRGCEGTGALFWVFQLYPGSRGPFKLCQVCGSTSCGGSRDFFGQIWRQKVTWAKYSMLIGRDHFCCAVIG